jgi:hypothetical protein
LTEIEERVINPGQEIQFGVRNEDLPAIQNSAVVLVYHLKVAVILNIVQEF